MVCLIASTCGSCTASRRQRHHRLERSRRGGAAARRPGAAARTSSRSARQLAGQAGGVQREVQRRGASTRSISCGSRTRLTGPCTRYSACSAAGTARAGSATATRSSEVATSSRTAWPNWRCCQPQAQRRAQVASPPVRRPPGRSRGSGGTARTPDLAPGKQLAQMGADHAGQQHERPCRRPDSSSGSGSRAAARAAPCTMAMSFSRPKASRAAQPHDEVAATCWPPAGNGCAGSRLTGTSSGRTSRSKIVAPPSVAARGCARRATTI